MNKTLRRILTKTFGLSTVDEVIKVVGEAKSFEAEQMGEFKSSLSECFESIDKAISDLDRMIEIRDRTLAISSKELVSLNDEITKQAERQQAILNQLHSTTQLLGAGDDTKEHDLNKLVIEVDNLVKNQVNAAKNLRVLYEEGIRISSVLNFSALETQLDASICRILNQQTGVKLYFAAQLLDLDESDYFSCDSFGRAADKMEMEDTDKSSRVQFLAINSAKGNGILAFTRIEFMDEFDSSTVLSILQPLIPNIAATLENIRLMQEEKRKQHMAAELQTARFVQQALLPPSKLIQAGGLEISGFYQSASECGGDWWSHLPLADGTHLILIGDVTGHGTGSAMICAVVKGFCDSYEGRGSLSPAQVLCEVNRIVYRVSSQGRRAMTMSAILMDTQKGEIVFANAGHPHPILVRGAVEPTLRAKQFLINSGPILGLTERAEYAEKKLPLRIGDRLILYSDGLTEYANRNHEFFGTRRLSRIIEEMDVHLSAADINRSLVRQLREFSLGEDPQDDITSVIIRNVGTAAKQQAS